MRFGYTEFISADDPDEVIWRPMLRARLHGPLGAAMLDMLVDSGSDETQVPLSLVEALGIPLTAERVLLQGLGGTPVEARVARATFSFRDHQFESRIVAATGPDQHYFLLGHRDFFAHFWVAFDDPRHEFRLSAHARRTHAH